MNLPAAPIKHRVGEVQGCFVALYGNDHQEEATQLSIYDAASFAAVEPTC
jgi:hypothetical protein